MVLRAAVLLLVLLSACATGTPTARLDQPMAIAVSYVHEQVEKKQTANTQDRLSDVFDARLAERNFHTARVSADDALAARRTTKLRLAELAKRAGDADFVLLVELRTTFYVQINGLWRWSIVGRTTIARSDLSATLERDFSTSAFTQFAYQTGDDALWTIRSRLADRIDDLVDDFLSADIDSTSVAPTQTSTQASVDPGFVYFAMVDRFENGRGDNDGAIAQGDPAAWHGGDLAGAKARLDWLASLGASTLWLSPLYLSQRDKLGGHGAFHGYWVRDHFALDPHFGTPEELRGLSDDLRARGMGLWLDVVVNHVGYDSPLPKQKPDWFHHRGDIKDWNDPEQLVFNDVHGLPDLAVERSDVYDYLLDSAKQWIDRAHPTGFRLDAVKHVPLEFWAKFNRDIKAHAGDAFFLIGEHLSGRPDELAQVIERGHFDSLFDFPVHFALVDTLCRDQSLQRLASVLSQDDAYRAPEALVTLLDNHDLPRIASVCGPDRLPLALETLFVLRGRPSLAWGTEVALQGDKEPENRASMRFDEHVFLGLIKGAVEERRAHPALASGKTRILSVDADTLVLLRVHAAESVVVTIHKGATEKRLDLGALLSASGATSPAIELEVPPRSVRVVSVELDPRFVRGFEADGCLERRGARRARVSVRVQDSDATKMWLVGGGDLLGSWDPSRGVRFLQSGDAYTAEVDLPPGRVYTYKLVREISGGLEWESGPNRYATVGWRDKRVELSHTFMGQG